jgi:CRISPR-associated protein Csm3
MKLSSYSTVKGIIRCESGLRIGGSKDSLEIGTTDNPIIRHPISDLPYIPGSSLKGKMRSLLEVKAGSFSEKKKMSTVHVTVLIVIFVSSLDVEAQIRQPK